MSYSTVLGVVPNRRPVGLLELRNSSGWAPSIWGRLCQSRGHDSIAWFRNDEILEQLWTSIEDLPPWQQVPLVLTFDTGVIPDTHFEESAELLYEFDSKLSAPSSHANHVPAVAEFFKSRPEVPLLGIWGTSVSENPFDPWDEESDEPGSGISLGEMYVLPQHRDVVLRMEVR